jgi:hypothetical protein
LRKPSSIILDQPVIDKCATTPQEFDGWIETLADHLGSSAIAAARQNLSMSHVSHIGRCALQLRTLSNVSGFRSVVRQIRSARPLSLYEPHGAWFHLQVAYLLCSIGEADLRLEQVVNGIPRDIVLRQGQVHVECRSFDIASTVRKVFSSADPVLGPDDDERAFVRRFRLLGPFGMSPAIGVSELYRFVQNAIEEKRHQVRAGHCNISAFNSGPFGRDAQLLRPALLALLRDDDRNRPISAFLAIDRGSDSDETIKSRVFRFDVCFVENPESPAAVPSDLVTRLATSPIVVPSSARRAFA